MRNLRDYERLSQRFARGYITLEQLARYVKLGVVTPKQYEELCGQAWPEQ